MLTLPGNDSGSVMPHLYIASKKKRLNISVLQWKWKLMDWRKVLLLNSVTHRNCTLINSLQGAPTEQIELYHKYTKRSHLLSFYGYQIEILKTGCSYRTTNQKKRKFSNHSISFLILFGYFGMGYNVFVNNSISRWGEIFGNYFSSIHLILLPVGVILIIQIELNPNFRLTTKLNPHEKIFKTYRALFILYTAESCATKLQQSYTHYNLPWRLTQQSDKCRDDRRCNSVM